jgi:hypothetical protein
MQKEFVPYELALKLKQLGFDEPCFGYYKKISLGNDSQNLVIQQTEIGFYNVILIPEHTRILAPLFQQAFRWFRDKHDLFGKIEVLNFGADEYCFEIYDLFEEKTIYDNFQGAAASYTGTFNTYEESELACLERLIEIVETKQQEQ